MKVLLNVNNLTIRINKYDMKHGDKRKSQKGSSSLASTPTKENEREMFYTYTKLEKKVDLTIQLLNHIIRSLNLMSVEVDALVAEVATVTTVEQSAIALIQGIAAQVTAAVAASDAETIAKVKAVTDTLVASSTALAGAVTAATPAAPAPVVEPAPVVTDVPAPVVVDPAAPAA